MASGELSLKVRGVRVEIKVSPALAAAWAGLEVAERAARARATDRTFAQMDAEFCGEAP